MKQHFFVTGTGTDIGKSFITAALARQAQALKRSVAAYKPVMSGFDPVSMADSDAGRLLQSMEQAVTPDNIARIAPWRFAAPLAPSMAGRLAQRAIDFDALIAHGHTCLNGPEDVVLIEGVGGVMVPLNETQTVLDWIAALAIPALLVTGNYLGSISHTLTALAVLRQRNIPVAAIIINESPQATVTLAQTHDELARWAQGAAFYTVTRLPAPADGQDITALRPILETANAG